MADNGEKLSVGEVATANALYCPGWVLAALPLLPFLVLCWHTNSRLNEDTKAMLLFSLGLSIVGYLVTVWVLPAVSQKLKSKLSGVDLGKKFFGGPNAGLPIPEGCGIVSGAAFLSCLIITQVFYHRGHGMDRMLEYGAAMLTICFAMMLGLADDVMDIKWTHKMVLSGFASLPLVCSYVGPTDIIVPKLFRGIFASQNLSCALNSDETNCNERSRQTCDFLPRKDADGVAHPLCTAPLTVVGELAHVILGVFNGRVDKNSEGAVLELGNGYLLYMVLLVIFCTMAINIYAGINGLEAGQSYVIACGILTMNFIEIIVRLGPDCNEECEAMKSNHLFSIMVMIPFAATTLGLLRFNWFPAKVFVGDSFPYYAGMTIATAAILGHFSKSVILLMIPQLLNFLYSLPQLFKIVPIPRHRLPKPNPATGLLEPSTVAVGDPRPNMTLICLAMRIFGPLHERTLCVVLLAFQFACTVIGLLVRYAIAGFLYDTVEHVPM